MKKILLFGVALLAMVSCEKYDDSDVWNAINDLKAKQENASKEGVTPVVKTVNEEMFISYDNGTTWTKMSNGMYSEISYDERYVVFTLTDGTELKVLNANYVVPIEKGAIKAAFSVGEGKQVYFSQGNLQYQASTGVWRFATNQWEAIGEGNMNIAEDYDGWIDLFGWGTSGWNSGAVCYQPYQTSSTNSDYFVGGSETTNLTGAYANADWGVYNKIANGGNQTGMWRVLTNEECIYLCNYRVGAKEKRGCACVNGINGLVLLPDNWILPEGQAFNSGFANGEDGGLFQTINNYSLSQWAEMEKNGAIFLPAAGTFEKKLNFDGKYGKYWSSTRNDENSIYKIGFSAANVNPKNVQIFVESCSVRLVQDVK
ncbi:MAG: DUF4988 domain-containing protein [Bacteroidales bacterium]|nr:DUF4988 domain-containing protein [Bacteroidales bacterium]